MKVRPAAAYNRILSRLFDSVFEMENSRSDIDQLVREITMEAAGEIPSKSSEQV